MSKPDTSENGKRRFSRALLIASAVLALLLVASLALRLYTNDQINIFSMAEYGKSLQNNRILVAEDKGITYLGTYQNTVLAFDKTGEMLWSYVINGSVGAMRYDEEKNWLIIGSQDRNVYIFDALSGEMLKSYNVAGKVFDMDYDKAGRRLLVSANVSASKHTIYVLDIDTGAELMTLSLKQKALGARFDTDYQSIYYGDSRGRITKTDLAGNTLASGKARTEVRSIAVIPATGEVVAIDEKGNLFKYDKDLNQLFTVLLVGEGKAVGVSDDGRWIAAGTREGDIYILDGNGKTHFTDRQTYDISQVYFGSDISYVVTLSPELFEFSTHKLDNIGLMSTLNRLSVILIIAFAVLCASALIATFPRSRDLAARFFRSMSRT